MRFTELSNSLTLPKRARPLTGRVAVVAETLPEQAAVAAHRVAARPYPVAAHRVAVVVAHREGAVPQCHHRHSMGSTPIA